MGKIHGSTEVASGTITGTSSVWQRLMGQLTGSQSPHSFVPYVPVLIAILLIPKFVPFVSIPSVPACFFAWHILASSLATSPTHDVTASGPPPSHHRGRKSVELGAEPESPGPNMAFSSAIQSSAIESGSPAVAHGQTDCVRELGSTSTTDDGSVPPAMSTEVQSEFQSNHVKDWLEPPLLKTTAPQANVAQLADARDLEHSDRASQDIVKEKIDAGPLAISPAHFAGPELCSETMDPMKSFSGPMWSNVCGAKPSEQGSYAQLFSIILPKLRPQCTPRTSLRAALRRMVRRSKSPQMPPQSGRFPSTPQKPPTVRSPPRRHPQGISKLFTLGLLLYALSSGSGSAGFLRFDFPNDPGQSPDGTNSDSQGGNDAWSRYDPYFRIPTLARSEPERTVGADDTPVLPAHMEGMALSAIDLSATRPTLEQVNFSPAPPPPLGLNAHNQQGSAGLYNRGTSHTIPAQGHPDNTPFPQQGLTANYGVQTPHHPPAPQASFHIPSSQIPLQPGAPNRTTSYVLVPQRHAPTLDALQRPSAELARNPHQARSFQTSATPGDIAPDHLRQWVSTLGQPDPQLQPDLDERGQSAYLRGYTDARRDLIAEIVAVAQANPQLAQAEPSTHAQEEGEVSASLLPEAPTPQFEQVASGPDPPTVAQEVSNKPGSEPYAPPTPPCDNTDPEPPFETLGASTDPTIDSQAPHQESMPDAQNVDHHTPETIHVPQPVAPVPITSSPPPPPAPAPAPSLVPVAPYPSLPTPAATPVTQGESNKPHVCSICGAAYPRPYLLRDHMISKHGNTTEKPYGCDFEGCNSRFSTRSNMRKHFNRKHRGSGTPHGNGANQAGPSS